MPFDITSQYVHVSLGGSSADAGHVGPDADAVDLQECIGDLAAEIIVSSSVCLIATVSSADAVQPQLKRDAPGMLRPVHAVNLSRMDLAERSDMIRVRLGRFGWPSEVDMVCEQGLLLE